jgi:hypothetical protein
MVKFYPLSHPGIHPITQIQFIEAIHNGRLIYPLLSLTQLGCYSRIVRWVFERPLDYLTELLKGGWSRIQVSVPIFGEPS